MHARSLIRILPATVLPLAVLLSNPVAAKHPLPGPHFVDCTAIGNTVRVEWDHLGTAEEFHEALLHRDDDLLVKLDPQALSHDDIDVPPGHHVYRLDIVLLTGDRAGDVIASRSCEVDVLLDSQIRCEVFGGIATPPEVFISWDPLPDNLAVLRIDIRRDGEVIADLPPQRTEYMEAPLHGEHRYTVIAILVTAEPGGDVIVGECIAIFDPPVIGGFRRGDCNGDESLDVSDPVCLLMHLFRGRSEPPCPKSADGDDNGILEVADALLFLQFLFLNGPSPAAPFLECGHDTTSDDLVCELFPSCLNPPPP